MGFAYVVAGPFVRSSYKAGELFIKNMVYRREQSNSRSNPKQD
jgi:lipoyl synthase